MIAEFRKTLDSKDLREKALKQLNNAKYKPKLTHYTDILNNSVYCRSLALFLLAFIQWGGQGNE